MISLLWSRAIVKIIHIKSGVQYHLTSIYKLLFQYIKQFLVVYPVSFIGRKWIDDPEAPIAMFIGFNPWKRQDTSKYFPEYRCAFVHGHAWFFRVLRNFVWQLPSDSDITYVVWGVKEDLQFKIYRWYKIICKKKIKILHVEDGFLRSIGTGLLHTRACSLCVDTNGLYFQAGKETDLEKLFNYSPILEEADLLIKAKELITLFKVTRATKYYPLDPYGGDDLVRSKRYSVLVIGQVEDDASIKYGMCKIKKNNDLILKARAENPNAEIYYRPHPDYYHNTRKSLNTTAAIEKVCKIVSPKVSLQEMFDCVDHVYTMTSLSGLEALIHGKKVTCFGAPFYSGWGLTDDRVKVKRRKRKLNLEQLFAGAYLAYAKYIHPASDSESKFQDIVGYFAVEVLKFKDIFSKEFNNDKLFNACLGTKKLMGRSFDLLLKIKESGDFAALTKDNFWGLFDCYSLEDFLQNSYLLSKSSNYDILVEYCNKSIDYLDKNRSLFMFDTTLVENYFYSLSLAMLQTNGRVIKQLPDFSEELLLLTANDKHFSKIHNNYMRCLSCNLQYKLIESIINKLHAATVTNNNMIFMYSKKVLEHYVRETFGYALVYKNFRDFIQVLQLKPSRSERDADYRHRIINYVLSIYKSALDTVYKNSSDPYVNKLIVATLRKDAVDSIFCLNQLVKNFKTNGSEANSTIYQILHRKNDLVSCANFFAKTGDTESVQILLKCLDLEDDQSTIPLLLTLYKKTGEINRFYQILNRFDASNLTENLQAVYARHLREECFFERSQEVYLDMYRNAKSLSKKNSISEELNKIKFCLETSSILNSVSQPRLPKGVVFLASQTCFNTLAMLTPALVELKRQGYAVVNLCAGITIHESTGIDYIDRFSGVIPLDLVGPKINNNWNIDWVSKKVESSGVNFYQGFYERLSTYTRRFFVDINEMFANKQFFIQLQRSDLCLSVCKDVYENLVGRGMPVAFVSGNSHVTPFSIFRDFCMDKKSPLLSYVNCNVAYESYFSNLGSKFANTMCVTDMTLYPTIRAPFMARKDQFYPWYENNKNNTFFVDRAHDLINVNRVGSDSSGVDLNLINQLKNYKLQGKKIVCAFGKVPVDLNVPYDGGHGHADMSDWITHTVQVISESSDHILLIKPHPHELRPEIALDLVDSFYDLIKTSIPENVIILGHKDINGHALAPYLDLAVLYNGSSSLELTAQGIPVLLASYFGKYDYPILMNYPSSRDSYREFLLQANYPIPTDELRRQAAFLLCYFGTDEISIVNQYSKRQLTNDKVGTPKWRRQRINEFFENGDPQMKVIAERVVEKFKFLSRG